MILNVTVKMNADGLLRLSLVKDSEASDVFNSIPVEAITSESNGNGSDPLWDKTMPLLYGDGFCDVENLEEGLAVKENLAVALRAAINLHSLIRGMTFTIKAEES